MQGLLLEPAQDLREKIMQLCMEITFVALHNFIDITQWQMHAVNKVESDSTKCYNASLNSIYFTFWTGSVY